LAERLVDRVQNVSRRGPRRAADADDQAGRAVHHLRGHDGWHAPIGDDQHGRQTPRLVLVLDQTRQAPDPWRELDWRARVLEHADRQAVHDRGRRLAQRVGAGLKAPAVLGAQQVDRRQAEAVGGGGHDGLGADRSGHPAGQGVGAGQGAVARQQRHRVLASIVHRYDGRIDLLAPQPGRQQPHRRPHRQHHHQPIHGWIAEEPRQELAHGLVRGVNEHLRLRLGQRVGDAPGQLGAGPRDADHRQPPAHARGPALRKRCV
jgi:hypothetical protein